MKKMIFVAATFVIFLTGCAKKAEDISAAYVSPLQYQNYTCNQLQNEMIRLDAKVSEISGIQNKTATKDEVAMGVGLVVFWPALFFLASGDDKKEELSRLKGEYEALQKVGNQKNCTFLKKDQNLTKK